MQPIKKSPEKKENDKAVENCNILVYIRVRPTLPKEYEKEIAVKVTEDERGITVNTRANVIQAQFDRAFGPDSTQQQVFEAVEHFVPAVLRGFHSTVFAYGQTGSGKTHTIFGSDWENLIGQQRRGTQQTFIHDIENDQQYVGVIPRMIYQVFKQFNSKEHAPKRLAVYCSFLQIYNEKIYDLLQDRIGTNSLAIRENKFDGIYVEGLVEFSVFTFEECLTLMKRGEKNRFTRQTTQNVKSSRSHTIFQLLVESTIADTHGKLQKAKLNICDLAGSEKLKKEEDIGTDHLKELKGINLSLTTLGKVIQSLSSKTNLPVPYRESKLTRLLQDSLGGNTQTCLIATLTPTAECTDETMNTIKFAERARLIVTKVSQNQISATDDQLVQKLKKEIEYLREILNIKRQGISHIGEVHHKLLILKEENQRLRENHISIQEVEKLLEENKLMKFELQRLRNESSPEIMSPESRKDGSGYKSLDLSTQYSPIKAKESLLHDLKKQDGVLPAIADLSLKTVDPTSVASIEVKSTKSEFERLNDLIQSRNSFRSVSKRNSDKLARRSYGSVNKSSTVETEARYDPHEFKLPSIKKTEMNVRIRERTTGEQKRLEDKQKEKARAIDRLRDLQRIQDHNKLKLEQELNELNFERGKSIDKVPSSVRGNFLRHSTENAKFNPYSLRTEIEGRYSERKREEFISKQMKKIDEYKSKIKRIEENYLG